MSLKSEAQYAIIDATVLGNTTLVAAVTGKKIRVLAAALVTGSVTVTVRFESNAGGTALTGAMRLDGSSILVFPLNGFGWFETAVGELLNLELNAAALVRGALVYQEIDDS